METNRLFLNMRVCCLLELLNKSKNLVGAEIGVAGGDNALVLCNLDIKRLYLVDPYIAYLDSTQGEGLLERGWNKMKADSANLLKDNPVAWIYRKSVKAKDMFNDESLDFVYIDADHQYKYVLEDIKIWSKKVKNGGIVAGHDISIPDVKKAVEEYGKYEVKGEDWYFIK